MQASVRVNSVVRDESISTSSRREGEAGRWGVSRLNTSTIVNGSVAWLGGLDQRCASACDGRLSVAK